METDDRSARLETFAAAIRDYEGRPGDLNYRNNNPGNFRCSAVGYLPKYGAVKCVNNFSVFPTYAQGWLYLKNIILERAKKHPNWTFLDFFSNYAPVTDHNNPTKYAQYVAVRCDASIHTTLKEYFS